MGQFAIILFNHLELGTKILRTEGGQPKDIVRPQDYEKAVCGCIEACLPWMEKLGITFSIAKCISKRPSLV